MGLEENKQDDTGLKSGFVLNDCVSVYPLEGRLERDGELISIQPMEMKVLLALANRAGQVVTKDEIISEVWGERIVGPEALTQKVHALRQHLGDKTSDPSFIETLPRIGNRLIAKLELMPTATTPEFVSFVDTRSDPNSDARGLFSVLSDLRQRNVFRVAYLYCAVGWLLTQVAETMADVLNLPESAVMLTVVFVILGFPLALVMAYALEVGPDGSVRRANPSSASQRKPIRRAEMALVLGCVVAVGLFLYWLKDIKRDPGPVPISDNSIAVLPFDNLSPSPDDGYFGDGLAEDLRLNLGRRSSLVVAPRVFTHQAMQSAEHAKRVGNQLGVAWLLTGTARIIDSRIRVTTSLISVSENRELWTEEYDVKTSDPMSLQVQMSQTIALTVAELLDAEVDVGIAVVSASSMPDFETYSAYLKGLEALGRPRSESSLALAGQAFSQSVNLDAGFAGGYVGLCETQLAQYTLTRETDFVAQAVRSCNRALELDSGLALVHLALGKLYFQKGEYDSASRAFNAAIDRDEGLPEAYSGLGMTLAKQGAAELAEQNLLTALKLRPHWGAYNNLGEFMLQRGQFQKAEDYYANSTRLNPSNAHTFNNLGAARFYLGDIDGAANAYRSSLGISPSRAAFSNLGSMYYFLGHFSDAADNFEKALDMTPADYRLWGNMGDSLRFNGGKRPYDASEAYTKAIALVGEQLAVNPQDIAAWANQAWYAANLGRTELADNSLEQALELDANNAESLYVAALIYALRGNATESIQMLAKASENGYPAQIIAATPEFSGFTDMARYRAIIDSSKD